MQPIGVSAIIRGYATACADFRTGKICQIDISAQSSCSYQPFGQIARIYRGWSCSLTDPLP